jgi:hypothetical protein
MSRVKSEMEFKGRRALGRVGDNDKSCAPFPSLRLHVRLHVQPLSETQHAGDTHYALQQPRPLSLLDLRIFISQ